VPVTLSDLLDRFDLLLDTPNAIPQLRQFILQLAVQGRLTEQDPDDEPAEALLERIQTEKKRLYDEKEIRKSQAKLPEIADGPPLPDRWIWIELERAGVVNPRHDTDNDTTSSFVPMKLIQDEVGDGHEAETRPWGEIRRGYTHFKEGDVGLAKITPCFQNRKSTVFRNLENGIGAGTTELYVFRPLAGTVLPEFVLAFFQSSAFIRGGVSEMTGTAGQQRVPRSYVEQSLLPLPPLEEQKRIVETVDRLIDECDALEATQTQMRETQSAATVSTTHALRIAPDTDALRTAWDRVATHFDTLTATPDAVDELRQTILQLAVQGRLTEQDPDDEPAEALLEHIQTEKQRLYDAGEIRKPKTAPPIEQEHGLPKLPAHWIWTRLADTIFEMKAGSSPKCPGHPADPDTWGVLRTTAVQPLKYWQHENKELPDTVSPRKDHETKEGDLLITRAGPRDRVGVACYVEETRSKLMFSDKIIRCRSPLVSYLSIAINGGFPASYIDDKKSGMAESQMNISQTNLRATPIPLPPLAEQKRIVKTVDRLMDVCDQLQEKLEQSRVAGEQWVEASLKETKVIRNVPVGAAQ
jgi:type I restriction enzyme S subunit